MENRPAHIGTSIGVTRSLASMLTEPFEVMYVIALLLISPTDRRTDPRNSAAWPGSCAVTELSIYFSKQGERNLGVSLSDVLSEDVLKVVWRVSVEQEAVNLVTRTRTRPS